MNKFFATIALAALGLSGCIKENNSYKDLLPVQPGITIYNFTMNQNIVSMQPANAAVRLAMLLEEAALQNDGDITGVDLSTVKVGTDNVKERLFGSPTTIEPQGEGVYKITYNEDFMMPDYLYLKGTLMVDTKNSLLSDALGATPWVVTAEDFKVIAKTDDYSLTQIINVNGGRTTLYASGGSYEIRLDGIRANIKDNAYESYWSGNFALTPKDGQLAYSKSKGQEFEMSGSASGPSMYTQDNVQALTMSYVLEDGVYQYAKIKNGTQICEFTNRFEYNTSVFPASEVEYIWTEGKNKIRYNGYVYPKE